MYNYIYIYKRNQLITFGGPTLWALTVTGPAGLCLLRSWLETMVRPPLAMSSAAYAGDGFWR